MLDLSISPILDWGTMGPNVCFVQGHPYVFVTCAFLGVIGIDTVASTGESQTGLVVNRGIVHCRIQCVPLDGFLE